MTNCRVYRGVDIDTDHRLLKATMCTPSTRNARRRYNKSPTQPKPDIKSLLVPKLREEYVKSLNKKIQNVSPSNDDINIYAQNLIKIVEDSAKETLPSKVRKNREKELWKDDELLNSYLKDRSKTERNGQNYKEVSKKIKKRIRHLRNLKMQEEADEINEHATNRQVEDLFKSIKSDGSTFKATKRTNA